MRPLVIGITIGLRSQDETLWNNGIKQNAVFLADALRNCPTTRRAVLVNTTDVPVTPALPWDLARFPTVGFERAKDEVDVLIELGGQIDAHQTAYLKARGVRLVSYCCGFEYVHAMESVLFRRPSFGRNLFVNQGYDAIWMIPQVDRISRAYFEVLRRRPAQVVPFVWSPLFLSASTRGLLGQGVYQPRAGARRISIMEPNLNVTKFCLYPALIAELAYRARPDAIGLMQVTNALDIATGSNEFIALMSQLDIVRNHKAVFLGRQETPRFLAESTDIVISHQWENPLNYFYLEVCWQGYPLVHNAELCPDLGYYYVGNDVEAGARQVMTVLDGHDARAMAWRERQRRTIGRYLPSDPAVVGAYDGLLRGLYGEGAPDGRA